MHGRAAGWSTTTPRPSTAAPKAIGEVGGFSLTLKDDLRLYLIETAEKGMAWLNLMADGTAGHGSMRNTDNAVTELVEAVTRIGTHEWPNRDHADGPGVPRSGVGGARDRARPRRRRADPGEARQHRRMVGATMRNTRQPDDAERRLQAQRDPRRRRRRTSTAGSCPGGEDEFFATINELLGDKVRDETVVQPSRWRPSSPVRLVEAMQACLAAEDPQSRTAPLLMWAVRTPSRGAGWECAASGSYRCSCRRTSTSWACSTASTSGCRRAPWNSVPGSWTASSIRPDAAGPPSVG